MLTQVRASYREHVNFKIKTRSFYSFDDHSQRGNFPAEQVYDQIKRC